MDKLKSAHNKIGEFILNQEVHPEVFDFIASVNQKNCNVYENLHHNIMESRLKSIRKKMGELYIEAQVLKRRTNNYN